MLEIVQLNGILQFPVLSNLSAISSISSLDLRVPMIEKVARYPCLQSSIVLGRYVLTRFMEENERSFSPVVTGIVQAIWYVL